MSQRPPRAGRAPWPFAATDPPQVSGREPNPTARAPEEGGGEVTSPAGAGRGGSADLAFFAAAGPAPARLDVAPPDVRGAAEPPPDSGRAVALVEAREALAAALVLLDQHSRSPAAAHVDLAIHYLNGELGR